MNAVHKLHLQHKIKTLCRVLRVNRSTYYKHFHSAPAPRSAQNQELASLILRIHSEHRKRLGAYKITYVLERDYGIHVSVGRVYRLMKTLNLPKMSTDKPVIRSKSSTSALFQDHLQQKFQQKAPDLVWVSDFTYIKTGGKWYYLCIIMDLFSRKVIAWHISAKPDTSLILTTFHKAYAKRNPPAGLMFHSDQGSQYTASAFRQLLDSLHIVQSFSKRGYPFDNACCECFFKYLKKEQIYRNHNNHQAA